MSIKKKFDASRNFIIRKGRMRPRLLTKFVIFMDMMQYQYVWYKAGLSLFNVEIFISKMHLALVDQLLHKSMKLSKKLAFVISPRN